MKDLLELLQNNPYPGRGIVIGRDRAYYFIMGRSENSRNRIFSQTGDGIGGEGMVIEQGIGAVKPHIKGGLIGRYLFGQILRQGLEHLAAKNNMGIMGGHEVTSFILWIML